ITLLGVLWAALVVLSLYIVRKNVENTDYPTCQFAARALPSAGVLNFLQSFVCNVNNECSSMEQFEEIPSFEKSKFTELQRHISSIITNETVIDTAANVPDALKLLATLSDIADNALFLNITKNGLRVGDIFNSPRRAKRYLAKELELTEDIANSIINAEIGFEGIMQGNLDRCNADSISKTIKVKNVEHLKTFVQKLCILPKKTVQNLIMGLVSEANLGKYITMIGDMYYKLSGDVILTRLGDMMVAVLRMMSMDSFMPPELTAIILDREVDFSYVNLTMVKKVVNLFQSTFGDTESFKTVKEVVDTAVIGVEYLQKFLTKQDVDNVQEVADFAISGIGGKFKISEGFHKVSKLFSRVTDSFTEMSSNSTTEGIFNTFSGITNFIMKFLPKDQKHEALFYSTLLAKLVEGGRKVININMHIEQLAYDVSQRNPEGIKVLMALPPNVITNGLEALADAERIQIMTSKLNDVSKMFCDTNRIKNFFLISKEEASSLKSQLCTEAWNRYIYDLVSNFGVYDVKDNINSMASLFVLETLGKDISNDLYSIDKDFDILRNFTEDLEKYVSQEQEAMDWTKVFNVSEDSEVSKAFRKKAYLGKHILITVHGALAKEVVSQNPLLEFKISPFLKNTLIIVDAINAQLEAAPRDLQKKAKEFYPDIIKIILTTALDEKMYKTLSTPCQDIFCYGPDTASIYLNFPREDDDKDLFTTLCNITNAIEQGLEKESIIGKSIRKVQDSKHSILEEINWTGLITGLNNLYEKLYNDYTYLFEYKTFNMNEKQQKEVAEMMKEVKKFWLDMKNLNRMWHLSIKFGLRFLDILDRGIFGINSEGWFRLKYSIFMVNGPLTVVDDLVKLIGGITRNETISSSVPPTTATALINMLPNVPYLIKDSVDIIVSDNTDIVPIVSLMNTIPPWPCSGSLTQHFELSNESQMALKSLETIMCLNADFLNEWSDYLAMRNATVFRGRPWNTTDYPDNIILKFSATFDSLVRDLDTIKQIFNSIFEERNDGPVTLLSALQYSVEEFDGVKGEEILKKFLRKVDTVLNAIDTSSIKENVALNILWQEYIICTSGSIDDHCRTLSRATWKHTLKFIATTFGNITEDLYTYFKESNEPNSTVLEALGFTRDTGLYMLYDKMPDFIAVLVNSYWDLGFMNKIRRASQAHFWDCDEVFQALNPGPDSPIDATVLAHVQTFVCPSFLHWISMPRGDNKLIDVFTKPQYFFFTLEVSNLTSTYEKFYSTGNELATLLHSLSNKSTENDTKLNTMKEKLERAVDVILSYEIKDTQPSYKVFNDINKKTVVVSVYLTRVVAIINKLATALDNLKMADFVNNASEDEMKSLDIELGTIQKLFKKRPSEVIALHFDVITDVLWTNNNDFKMSNALNDFCNRLTSKDNSKNILVELDRVKAQICAKKYEIIYGAVQNVIDDDFKPARNSLVNIVNTIGDKTENATDIFDFLNKRKQLVKVLMTSTKYAYDLGIPVYLKYLQSNLKHYNIVISFLSNGDWWKELRELYNGPNANNFFNTIEKGFDIAEDIITHLDRIHLVRLLRDINTNSTETFCQPNITISDYVPDSTSLLTTMQRQMCDTNFTVLYGELPPMIFASQGYDNALKLTKDVDYDALYSDLAKTESGLGVIKNGPKSPQRPLWVTKKRLERFREVALDLLSQDSLIKISFGVLSNIVDAGTLYLNNSQCVLCSQFTSWFKQINLQLYKKQEYDNLLCTIDHMSLEETYYTLKNDFHWDMAISELISTRNYTKYELNKSLNELLEQIKLHLLEDVNARTTKLSECLANNVTLNAVGNATLFAKVLARTIKLIRAELPHLKEVDGITEWPYFKQLNSNVAHNLNVRDNIATYLNNPKKLAQSLNKIVDDGRLVQNIEMADIDILLITELKTIDKYLHIKDYSWNEICQRYNCSEIISIITKHVNVTMAEANLPNLQDKEFWRFGFMSNILYKIEVLVEHVSRILGVASRVDIDGVVKGKLTSLIDAGMELLMDDTVDSILFSILGVLEEIQPLLLGTPLEFDLNAVADGLAIMHKFKNYLIEEDIRVNVSEVFLKPERIESSLSSMGINNTNFWSIAAPRIHAGYILIKPLLSQKQGTYHIGNFVCQVENLSKVLIPENVDVVTLDDIYGAVVDQFCGMDDDLAKEVISVLIENINFNLILVKIKSILLSKLFTASNLTQEAGDTVLSEFGHMASLLPSLQDKLGNVSESLANEPLLMNLRKSSSFGDMLTSSSFMADAGNMVCGKPFHTNLNRLYKAVVQQQDLSAGPDQAQLDALPTEFCRSLYKDIIGIEGGKIVWSFVKPLIVGKILYTPPNVAVQRIIGKANSTFSPMVKLTNLIHSFANSFSSVDKLSEHREGLTALQNLIAAPQYSAIRKTLLGDVEVPNVDINGVFEEFGDTEEIGRLLKKASDLLYCINLNRFKAMPNEHQLTLEAARLTLINEFSAGLVFLNMSESQSELPANIEYKIRMDIENAPTTQRLRNYLWTPGPESSFIENMRYFRGFVEIQDIVDKAIIQISMENSKKVKKRDIAEIKNNDWAVYTQQMPYPCYKKDFFQTSLYESQSLIVAFYFSLLFTVSSAVRFIVSDKETGNTMLMSVMGVNLSYHTLSWFICSFVEMVLTVGGMTAVLSLGGILPKTDPSLIFALMFVYGFSVLCFCYMMSKLFLSASSAAVCTGIAYLLSFMPFVLILSLEAVLKSSLKLFVSLSMSSSVCYAFLFITRFEAMGVGAGWPQIWDSPDNTSDMNIAIAAVMVIVDGILYLIIGLLVDRFYGIKAESNITNCQANGEKAGVSIVNVTKIYCEGSRRAKLALDNVSMELHKGQITTLLGHNGAGKTTLINILTGMLKVTKGHVIVRSDDPGGARLGVCPQKNVLFEYMTAREHVALYAQLKSNQALEEVQDEVKSMLHVLCLGDVCDMPVGQLSGGTRRRLCVALAFIARPSLVSLDEPTAGVDPAARRDIWSMIMRLRENRTILLTTHHLDEAELLSDQIIIMHKGQIHTTGSPIEIKRTLGSGYKLTVMYPDKKIQILEDDAENDVVMIEEKTKNLLAVTRSVVKNANLVDINGLEVEINLPFYDADGVSNNFLEMCNALETRESELRYQSYSLDCSSLEQVFFNICQQADVSHNGLEYDISSVPDSSSKSASTSSIKNDHTPLVPPDGPLKGSTWQQFVALMYARYLHYLRNRWLLFLLIVLPSVFITVAMGFATIRPPADAEVALKLYTDMYEDSTQFLITEPSIYSKNIDPTFAQNVVNNLRLENSRNWTYEDSPRCQCVGSGQQCEVESPRQWARPAMMLLPDVHTLNNWLIDSQQAYIEKRYAGFTSAIKNNVTQLVAWYNNKGHHALPAAINAVNSAVLRVVSGERAGITVYTHPMKISKEQLNKDTVYQHIADAGISGMLLIAYSLVSAGAAVYLVTSRLSQEKHLQMLCGVSPALYWGSALLWDMAIIVVNMAITAVVLEAFHFSVFVARSNLAAICILILLYGYACAGAVHVAEKLFSEASLATMLLFCGNAFVGLVGITLLLILDIISESDATDNARWVLHKILLLSPQFTLGDGLLEIAKNTIQAEVLSQFGMDTYRDPLTTNVVGFHYLALVLVGTVLILFNLAIEYDCFDWILARLRSKEKFSSDTVNTEGGEVDEIVAEAARVRGGLQPLRLRTIGNINAGFVDTEYVIKNGSIKRPVSALEDTAACVRLRKTYGERCAVHALTLGIPPGQCTALLGENGAGKSTTFSMLTGQLRPTSGQVYLRTRRVSPRGLCQGLISYCPQSDAIDPHLTVKETLKFYCRLRGITNQEEVIRKTVELFELSKYRSVRSGSLSGGNKRKLCAAIAFMGRAPLVMLDEPTRRFDNVLAYSKTEEFASSWARTHYLSRTV
ncbi:jg23217, partial [Pararge aegeria aegeria]